jgi:hypothetical protein
MKRKQTGFRVSVFLKQCFKNTWLFLFGIIFLVSCSNNTEEPIGKWGDNIGLSQKTAILSSNTTSVTITTKYSGWWLAGIGLDSNAIDLTGINNLSENFIVTNSEFQVERKNGKTIIITMNPNTTGSERILYVALQGGDYFDGIKVVQSK